MVVCSRNCLDECVEEAALSAGLGRRRREGCHSSAGLEGSKQEKMKGGKNKVGMLEKARVFAYEHEASF